MSENTDAQEAEKSLVKELGSKEPNIGQIVEILSAHTELQTKLIEPSTNGTALHVAARDDSKQDRTCVTKALLEIFDMDPNIGTAT